jgi:hypothetical protein
VRLSPLKRVEEFISGTLIDGVRATLSPDDLFVLEGLTFDKLYGMSQPMVAEGGRQQGEII